jgi:hypothetical protein
VPGVSYTLVSARRPGARVVGYLVFARAPNHAHQDAVLAALAGYLKNILAIEALNTDFLGFPRLKGAVKQGGAGGLAGVAMAGKFLHAHPAAS